MINVKKSIGMFGSIFALIFFCSPLAIEAATWNPPTTLSSTMSDQPFIAVDRFGNAVAVWQGFDGSNYVIQSSSLSLRGTWTTPVTLSDAGQDAQSPDVAVDRAGNAVAVWSRYDGTYAMVQSAYLPFGGSWSAAENLSALGGNADSPQIAMDDIGTVGNAVAVWHRYNGTNFVIQAATLPAGGSWSAPVDVSASGMDALIPKIAVDASGNATLTFSRYDGTNYTTRTKNLLYQQTWNPAFQLSAPGQSIAAPTVAVNSSGNAVIVWSEFDGTNFVIQAASLPFGGTWSTTVSLSDSSQNALIPMVAIDDFGNAVAIWSTYDGVNYIAQAATLLNGAAWSSPINLSPDSENVGSIFVDINDAGSAVLGWDRSMGANRCIQAVTWSKDAGWGTTTTISDIVETAYLSEIGVDESGDAVVVWLEFDGTTVLVKGATYN